MNGRSSISHARTYEEMAEFWETHDTADYWDQFQEVNEKMEILAAICADAQKLPDAQQREVLDFVQFLLMRTGQQAAREEELKWSHAALVATMQAMDEEEGVNAPTYTIKDAKERYD